MKTPLFPARVAVALATATGVFAMAAGARTWKDSASGQVLEGDYIRTEAGHAMIVSTNGSPLKIPLERLSKEDKKFIAEQAAAKAGTGTRRDCATKWETDFNAARKRANEENKIMLLHFTGSDWCSWCIRLKQEVFLKPEFSDYAKRNLVLVEVDFPQRTTLPSNEKEQNNKLAKEFKVGGFPSVVLIDTNGRELARTGYQRGGPDKYIEHLKDLLK